MITGNMICEPIEDVAVFSSLDTEPVKKIEGKDGKSKVGSFKTVLKPPRVAITMLPTPEALPALEVPSAPQAPLIECTRQEDKDLNKELEDRRRGTNGMRDESFKSTDPSITVDITTGDDMPKFATDSRGNRITPDIGNAVPLKYLSIGTKVHCIANRAYGPGIFARSAGTSAEVVGKSDDHVILKFRSNEVRKVPSDAIGTVGIVSNKNHQFIRLGKAGAKRWRGWRPSVRGVAMNPTDHPHGGGRGKSKGNRQPVSPTNVLAKGGKPGRQRIRWLSSRVRVARFFYIYPAIISCI